jgi:ribosomal protein S19
MKLFRFLNRLYAFTHGYFWLPCPICGEEFGGHEVTGSVPLYHEDSSFYRCRLICPSCTAFRQQVSEVLLIHNGITYESISVQNLNGRPIHHKLGEYLQSDREGVIDDKKNQ